MTDIFDPNRAYSNREIAEKVGVSRRTLNRWRKQNKLVAPILITASTQRTPGHLLNAWWEHFVTPDITPGE